MGADMAAPFGVGAVKINKSYFYYMIALIPKAFIINKILFIGRQHELLVRPEYTIRKSKIIS